MTLAESHGTYVTTSSFGNVFGAEQTGRGFYGAYISFHNAAAGDVFEMTVRARDTQSDVMRVIYNTVIDYRDISIDPMMFFPFIPAESYDIGLRQTSGAARTVNWILYRQPQA